MAVETVFEYITKEKEVALKTLETGLQIIKNLPVSTVREPVVKPNEHREQL